MQHAIHSASLWLSFPLLPLLCGGVAAQIPDSGPAPGLSPAVTAHVVRTAFGVDVVDAEVVAGGPDYKAHFADGRMCFTPAFGVHAERNYPLTLDFERVERGGAVLSVDTETVPARAGNRVSLARSGGIVERYDATERGLLLSFLVPSKPAGAGDLVVRLRVETDLAYAGAGADGGILFELPGVGGVSVGTVTAIDARGAAVAGELRLAGDALELAVPGAFVDAAAYPLVIDPEIGAFLTIDDNSWDDGDPAVAATSASDARYLVVWERRFSLSDIDLRGYRLDDDGGYTGSFLYIENGPELSNSPAIGHVRVSERFFVAWQETPSIFTPFNVVGRAVDGAATGAMSAKITLAASANMQSNPDVGGERTLADDDVYVVWGEANLGIRGCQVSLPTSGAAPSSFGVKQISDPVAGGTNTSPVISKSAGDNGIFGLAYQSGPSDVSYRTLSRNGTLTGAQLLLASIGGPHRQPSIDGDGTHFLLAFERGENFSFASSDVWGATFTFDGTALRPFAFEPIENDPSDHETNPDVVFTGAQFLVGYHDVDGAITNAYAKTIDPFTCLICESESLISATGGEDQDLTAAAFYSAGLLGDEALLVWETFASDGDILAQLYASPNGQFDLAGDCGQGGSAATPCPYAGNGNFALHLDDAAPLTPAFLVLAFQQSATGCGPCTLWPSLATAKVYYAGLTDAYGRLSFPVAIPPGTGGVQFVTQWGVTSGSACPLFGIDVSNGMLTTVTQL
jgi:hypothetical protein